MNPYIKKFNQISINDVSIVGGKNASLGELISSLSSKGICVPDGFATTSSAFWYFMTQNDLLEPIKQLMADLDRGSFINLRETGAKARQLMMKAVMPADLKAAISVAYTELIAEGSTDVAVRSSATAEDLPGASFAGQHESFLNICGNDSLIQAVQQCFASLYRQGHQIPGR